MSRLLLLNLAVVASVLACPQHDLQSQHGTLNRRAVLDWGYDDPNDWAITNPNYTLCQTGTRQSPINLLLTQGVSTQHIPRFNYFPISGYLGNWGYGAAFSPNSSNSSSTGAYDITSHPSLTYDNITLYLKGWHIHTPADHLIQGFRSKAELHLVHANASGFEQGVVAILIDPGNADSAFVNQFFPPSSSPSTFPNIDSTSITVKEIDTTAALSEVDMLNDFWTYQGGLPNPPCREGMRYWVPQQVLSVSNRQMQEILSVSRYSSRPEQDVWLHEINM